MAALIQAKDWSQTSLGPSEAWSEALRVILDITLTNRFPIVFWWGPDFVQLYNDPYVPVLAGKHPASLGQSARECWREIWDIVGPQIESVYAGGPSTWNEDQLLEMNRSGFVEETYFTFSYSAIADASASGGIGGVLATVQETTGKIVGERRIELLRDLATRASEPGTVHAACTRAVETLAGYAPDVPFALIYRVGPDERTAKLAASVGVTDGSPAAPEIISLDDPVATPWPLQRVEQNGSLVLDDISALFPAANGTEARPRSAVILPITATGELAGFLVAGVSPRLPFDAPYRNFYGLIASQLGTVIASAQAYEAERKRAEALAEIDRAKNVFFSNVSHEFRTPLTLMLGPLEELAQQSPDELRPVAEMAQRNTLRLLKLVNTLLEFSRLQAARGEAAYAPVDLARLTAELCGAFRSAIESAGVRYRVEIDLTEPVYVDTGMWEKIVLNLLSNALKFTLSGEIAVRLTRRAEFAELTVTDTGTGIAPEDLANIFERFRRVRGAKGRSFEGSGIGLALVKELVDLHRGTIAAESELGSGTTFRVTLPLGAQHLDPALVVEDAPAAANGLTSAQYLSEFALTPSRPGAAEPAPGVEHAPAARILIVDDNADLRAYLARLLSARYDVIPVANGALALDALRRERVDLILSDVMMPEIDGLRLLEIVRADPVLATTPFILLSARAGEEAAIAGMELDADDYLSKPFSAAELVARVDAHLRVAALRRRSTANAHVNAERFRALAASIPHIVFELDNEGEVIYLSDSYARYTGFAAESGLGRGWFERLHPEERETIAARWRALVGESEPFTLEFRLRSADGRYRWHVARSSPRHDAGRTLTGWTGTMTDIDDVRRSAREREFLADGTRLLAQSLDLDRVLADLAALTIPDLADWCQIDLRGADGGVRTVAVAHADPERHALAQQFVGRVHLNPDADGGSPAVIRTGRAEVYPRFPRELFENAVDDLREREMYSQFGVSSVLVVPIVAGAKTLGALSLIYGDSGRHYTESDVPLLEELGRRAGIALQNATEFEREHRVAESFQEASLPLGLPSVPGLAFDAMYVPGSSEALVGGDWYDAVRLNDGRIVIAIGDVAGSGLEAAVTMGSMRQIIRGIAQVHADPALMLDAADRALRLERADRFVTAFVGVIDPVAGTLAYASAGHPPAMLRTPDGAVTLLSDDGLPLGLRLGQRDARGKEVDLPDGSSLVLYTDGITEITRDSVEGERRLAAILNEVVTARRPAQAIVRRLLTTPTHDDVAVLVVEITGLERERSSADWQSWTFDVRDPAAVADARHAFVAGLRHRGVPFDDSASAELVFGELVGNAVRYAPGVIDVHVDWSGLAPVLHVLDHGPGFQHLPLLPSDIYSESGRGLYIVSMLTDDFQVVRRRSGGSHARAVLLVKAQRLPVLVTHQGDEAGEA